MNEPILTTHPLLVVIILTSIPVVSLALWADYYGRALTRIKEEFKDEWDPNAEMRRVKFAGAYAFFIQFLTFVLTANLRQNFGIPAFAIFAIAILIQTQIQGSVERKVTDAPNLFRDQLNLITRTVLWTTLSLSVFFGLVWGTLLGSHALLRETGLEGETKALLMISCGILGVAGATLLLLGLAPLHLRQIFPCSELKKDSKHSGIQEMIDACFKKVKLAAPKVWVLEMDAFRVSQAMISGLQKGRGIFAPGLFLSRNLLEGLTSPEIEAVILHEVSHWTLGHSKEVLKRSVYWLVGTIAALTVLLIAAQLYLPEAAAQIVRGLNMLFAVVLPYMMIRKIAVGHETEADIHCVVHLGADVEAFASSLRKLDQWNQGLVNPEKPQRALLLEKTHPDTEDRIARVKEALAIHLERKTVGATQAATQATKKKKAA